MMFASCQHSVKVRVKPAIDKERFLKYMASFQQELPLSDSILVIPGVGCGGCITNAQLFFENNSDNNQLFYVFTGIDDLKIFKQEIPMQYWNQANVFVDSLNYLMRSGFESNYPSWLIETGQGYSLKTFE